MTLITAPLEPTSSMAFVTAISVFGERSTGKRILLKDCNNG